MALRRRRIALRVDRRLSGSWAETALGQISPVQSRGKPADAPLPGAPRRGSHLRLPVHLDGTHALVQPNSTKRPLPLVLPCCTVAGAWGTSVAGEHVVAVPRDRRASGSGLLLGGRGGNTLVTLHDDAPHLGRCWNRRGKGRPRQRGRIAGSRQIWYGIDQSAHYRVSSGGSELTLQTSVLRIARA